MEEFNSGLSGEAQGNQSNLPKPEPEVALGGFKGARRKLLQDEMEREISQLKVELEGKSHILGAVSQQVMALNAQVQVLEQIIVKAIKNAK